MYPGPFDYVAPETTAEAVDHLAAAAADGLDAQVLAGGHGVLPDLKTGAEAPDLLVDVGDIDALHGVTVGDEAVRVGAATPYVAVGEAVEGEGALADALAVVGDRQVRNRGTLGGNLAEAAVGTDMPAPVLARDGRLVIQSPDGRREVSLADFYAAEATFAPAEVLTGVTMPTVGADTAGAYLKREHPHTGYPLVGVAALLTFDGSVDADRDGGDESAAAAGEMTEVTRARVAATGATAATPAIRLRATEAALEGVVPDLASGAAAAEPGTVPDDGVVSPAYREHLLEVFAERTLTRAFERRVDAAGTEP
jgi:carbon-monoxide dehydrogenase medium subunit